MIRAIIIEDEPVFIELIQSIIQENLADKIEIVASANNAEQGFLFIKKLEPHLIFLDVELNGMNGIELLQKFDAPSFHTIFTTSHDKYALSAIKQSAIDFLIKPYHKIEFINAIEKVEKRIALEKNNKPILQHNNHKIIISGAEGILFVDVDKIMHCESDSNYTTYYIKDGKNIIASKTLKEVENSLLNYNFCRVHRTHLVNLDYVVKYQKGDGGSLTLSNGTVISVSRSQKDELMKRLNLNN